VASQSQPHFVVNPSGPRKVNTKLLGLASVSSVVAAAGVAAAVPAGANASQWVQYCNATHVPPGWTCTGPGQTRITGNRAYGNQWACVDTAFSGGYTAQHCALRAWAQSSGYQAHNPYPRAWNGDKTVYESFHASESP
jgi:hypothetical protein